MFEFTAPYTPQQNGKIERKFATLWNKVRSMLNTAKVPKELRNKLWAQCANHATLLENTLLYPNKQQTPYFFLHNKQPPWINNLHIFGELAVIHDSAHKIQAKLNNKNTYGMFVGYPLNHSHEVCSFLNIHTKHMKLSRNYIFINHFYGDLMKLKEQELLKVYDDDEDDVLPYPLLSPNNVEDLPFPHIDDADEAQNPTPPGAVDPNDFITQRGIRELRSIQTSYNPTPFQYLPNTATANLSTMFDGNPDPKDVNEAKASPDWPNWWGAMTTELENMHKKEVWQIILKTSVPSNCKSIGNRWVFLLKDDVYTYPR
jgi:hypothetical protein